MERQELNTSTGFIMKKWSCGGGPPARELDPRYLHWIKEVGGEIPGRSSGRKIFSGPNLQG
jgi:hypothetical protein